MSALILGGMVACPVNPPLWVATLVVATFGIFHGYAHGIELPVSTSFIAYSLGFVLATALVQTTGILIGLANRTQMGARIVRASAAVISGGGVY